MQLFTRKHAWNAGCKRSGELHQLNDLVSSILPSMYKIASRHPRPENRQVLVGRVLVRCIDKI